MGIFSRINPKLIENNDIGKKLTGQSKGQHSTIEASKEPQHAGHSNTASSATNQRLVAKFQS